MTASEWWWLIAAVLAALAGILAATDRPAVDGRRYDGARIVHAVPGWLAVAALAIGWLVLP